MDFGGLAEAEAAMRLRTQEGNAFPAGVCKTSWPEYCESMGRAIRSAS